MNLAAVAATGSGLGTRFTLVGTIPLTVTVTAVAALVGAGAPEHAPQLTTLLAELERLSLSESVLLAVSVFVLAVLLTPLQLPLVRLLEGYWGPLTRGRLLTAGQRRRRAVLARRARFVGPTTPTTADAHAVAVAAWNLRHRFPPSDLVLPTRLGNVLRAAEDRAGRAYGLDAVVAWPRLYPLLDEKVAAIVDDQRNQMDVSARFAGCFLVAALVTTGLLAVHGWWLLVPAGFAVLARLAYRGAVASADGYGRAVEAAFDRHHLDLRAALWLTSPASLSEERTLNRQLDSFWRGGAVDLNYRTGVDGRPRTPQQPDEPGAAPNASAAPTAS